MEKEKLTFSDILKKIIKFVLFFGIGILFIYLSIKEIPTNQGFSSMYIKFN